MKSKLFLIFSLVVIIAIAGCATIGNVEQAATNTPDKKAEVVDKEKPAQDVAKDRPIQVDKGVFNVKVTIPASMFESKNIDEVIAKAKADGVGEVTKNDDGSITYKMTTSKHNEMMKEMESGLLKNIEEMKNNKDFKSIRDITHNKTFSEYTVSVDQEAYKNSFDGFVALGLGISGLYYQLFNGASVDNYKVTILIKNVDTGVVFNTIVYPDALKNK